MSAKPHPDEPRVMSASEVRERFSDVVNRVARGEGRVIVEKHGAPAVGVVSMEDIRRLRQSDDVVRQRTDLLQRFRAPFTDVPDDDLEAEIVKALAEVREDRRGEHEARSASTDQVPPAPDSGE